MSRKTLLSREGDRAGPLEPVLSGQHRVIVLALELQKLRCLCREDLVPNGGVVGMDQKGRQYCKLREPARRTNVICKWT